MFVFCLFMFLGQGKARLARFAVVWSIIDFLKVPFWVLFSIFSGFRAFPVLCCFTLLSFTCLFALLNGLLQGSGLCFGDQ